MDRGYGGVCTEGGGGEPVCAHSIQRTGKRKEHLDQEVVATRTRRILP